MQTGVMERPARVELPLDIALPGGTSTRGFWTKRRKTALSLLAVMALLAGIALAFKLFEQNVPNNVVRDASNFSFEISARDVTAGENAFRPATGATTDDGVFRQTLVGCVPPADCNVNLFPGDSRLSEVIIKNTNDPARRDASFQVYVDPASITVFRFTGGDPNAPGSYVPESGALATRFLSFWSLAVAKQTLFGGVDCNQGDCGENNPSSSGSYSTVCDGSLTSINRNAPCKLGIIRAKGQTATLTNAPLDDRQYRFTMREADDGTDQSGFKGWRIRFTLVFQARVPAEPETGRYSLLPNP